MKWFKRCWLSIIRRPVKSFLLLLVVFVMSNLLAGSLSIIYTSEEIKENIKESISPKVNLTFQERYKENGINKTRSLNSDDVVLYNQLVNKMAKDDLVLSFEDHYSLEIAAEFSDLGWPKTSERYFDIGLYGTNAIESTYFVEGDHKLDSTQNNRFLTQEELNSDEILLIMDENVRDVFEWGKVISTGLCDIGNEVTLTVRSYKEKDGLYYPHEYKFKAKIAGVLFNKSNEPYLNVAYISNKALFNLIEDANKYFKSVGAKELNLKLESTSFSMKEIENVVKFEESTKELRSQLPDGILYESSAEIYNKNVGPVENLDTIAKVIFVVSVLATIIVLGLVIVFFISDRKKEIGIYSSLGEKRKFIVSQVVCEILLVSTIAISLAGLSGIFVGNKLSDYMLEVQRYVQREQLLGELANVTPIYKPIEGGLALRTRDDVIDNYEIKPSVDYFAIIYAVGELSVIVSCVVPIWYLCSLKPKEIML